MFRIFKIEFADFRKSNTNTRINFSKIDLAEFLSILINNYSKSIVTLNYLLDPLKNHY